MLDHEPQSLEELRARYPAALEYLYIVDPLVRDPEAIIRPGECRANVFDFADGTRLIVSRERFRNQIVLHVSASAAPSSPIYAEIRDGRLSRAQFCEYALTGYRAISGDPEPLKFTGFSETMGIPHWFRPLEAIER